MNYCLQGEYLVNCSCFLLTLLELLWIVVSPLLFITLSSSLQVLFDKVILLLFNKSSLLFSPLSIFIIIDLSHDCGICSWLKISLKKEVSFSRSLLTPYFINSFFSNYGPVLLLFFRVCVAFLTFVWGFLCCSIPSLNVCFFQMLLSVFQWNLAMNGYMQVVFEGYIIFGNTLLFVL